MSHPIPWIVPVGGFLGAGKTTLILAAAKVVRERGLQPAAIFNDQGSELVDTQLARSLDLASGDVTGGCFCCQFADFMDAADRLHAFNPDIIFVEPVGSCTDLSRTVLHPLMRDFAGSYRLAPLTVLVDPGRDVDDADIAFLYHNQIAEADIVAYTKCDLYSSFPALPTPVTRYLSARTGQGVSSWLDEVLLGAIPAGSIRLDLDYEKYGRAEAALGWLNWTASIRLDVPLSPAAMIGPLIDNAQEAMQTAGAPIVHMKIYDQTNAGYLKAAVTGNTGDPIVEGDLTASPASRHEIRVNLRALAEPSLVRQIFTNQIARLPGEMEQHLLECFSPAPPRPPTS